MKRTPLYEEHIRLGAKMVEFSGWEMPLSYPAGILTEHLATRKSGGLFDISHMGRFLISGQDALPFLQRVLTNNAAALAPGQSQYTIIANERGGAVDDAYLYRLDEKEFLLVVNAANTEKDRQWFRNYQPDFPRLTLEDHTGKMAMLALQGPRTKAVLEKILDDARLLPEPTRNRLAIAEISGDRIPIARTGYTGEPVGFELFPSAENAVRLWQQLLEAGKEAGIVPVGLGARDTLRLEAGLPLYGHELGIDEEGREIPVFALPIAKIAVSFSKLKGAYIGRGSLDKQFREVKARTEENLKTPKKSWQVPRMIMPLAITGPAVARAGCPVYADGKEAGKVTSGTVIPYWKTENTGARMKPGTEPERRTICLAYLDADLKEGQRVSVQVRDKSAEALIVRRHLGSEAAPFARPLIPEMISEPVPVTPGGTAAEKIRNLARRTIDNNTWRQRKTINLIPSEQTASPLVRLLTIADPAGRYAEHRRVAALNNAETYYYQGTGFIAGVERELVERLQGFLGCGEVEVKPISGQMANAAVFSGLLDYLNRADRRAEPRRFRSVMNHHIGRGGHLSAQPMGALRNFISIDPVTERWAVINFPVMRDNPYRIDAATAAELIAEHKPELIILGKSLILHTEPVRELAKAAAATKPRPVIMYDAAHVLGLLGARFQAPLGEGADIITASTHKTFFGTQRGIIASNMNGGSENFDLWESIVRRVFPGSVSSHQPGTLLGLLMATYEMEAYGDDYQRQVMTNAKAFARALQEKGIAVEGDPGVDFTETHQVVLRVGYGRGVEMADRLEKNNLIVNYQALPDDEAFTASSGLRMGVQEMTRFGLRESDFGEVAEFIAGVIIRDRDVAQPVAGFRQKFTRMQYCLPEEQAGPLARELVENLL